MRKLHLPLTQSLRLLAGLCVLALSLPAAAQPAASSACAQFPEALVRKAFAVPQGQALENRAGATCRWSWVDGGRKQEVSVNFLRSARPTTIDLLFARMRDGFTQEVRGQQVTVAPKQVQWVGGVGDKAFWNQDLSQLAVYGGQRLFYVNVKMGGLTTSQKIGAASAAARAIVDAL